MEEEIQSRIEKMEEEFPSFIQGIFLDYVNTPFRDKPRSFYEWSKKTLIKLSEQNIDAFPGPTLEMYLSLADTIVEIVTHEIVEISDEYKIKKKFHQGVLDYLKFYDDLKSGNFQIVTSNWVGVTEPDMFYSVFHSKMAPPNGRNRGRYVNPRIDELTVKGQLVLDIQERKKIYSEIQKILAEDLPYIYFWYPHNIIVMNKRIQGFTPYPDGDFVSLKDVWIAE